MALQWIIVAVLVIAAAIYISRLIYRAIKSPGCNLCVNRSRTLRLLKMLSKKKKEMAGDE